MPITKLDKTRIVADHDLASIVEKLNEIVDKLNKEDELLSLTCLNVTHKLEVKDVDIRLECSEL